MWNLADLLLLHIADERDVAAFFSEDAYWRKCAGRS
jgi:hypothetical protein